MSTEWWYKDKAGGKPKFEGHSKINLRLVGKNKRIVTASKRTLSSNK